MDNELTGTSSSEGFVPIFLTVATQKIFGLVPFEDLPIEQPYKKVSKDDILSDVETKGVLSDFYGVKEKIEVCSSDL